MTTVSVLITGPLMRYRLQVILVCRPFVILLLVVKWYGTLTWMTRIGLSFQLTRKVCLMIFVLCRVRVRVRKIRILLVLCRDLRSFMLWMLVIWKRDGICVTRARTCVKNVHVNIRIKMRGAFTLPSRTGMFSAPTS